MKPGHLERDPGAPLSVSNFPRQVIDGPSLIHELIWSKYTDNETAIEYLSANDERTVLSYASLDLLTDHLSRKIVEKIGSPSNGQQIIPVLVPQAPELYISWIAVLKAGAAFCPIAPDTPPERLDFILDDVSASFVLCLPGSEGIVSHRISNISTLEVSLVQLRNELSGRLDHRYHENCASNTADDDLAYVMYTSGSTGKPKGVKVSHKSASQSLLAHDEHIPKFKRFLQFASPTFDVSVFETFFPLFRGATLISCERERMLADLPGTFNTLRVDAAELTPTVAGTLLRTRKAAPSLRLLLTIGEMLTKQVVEEFGGSEEHDSMLFAMYGPTEASIHCTLAPRLSATSSVRAIGQPLATVTAFVLAEPEESKSHISILPRGESGELAIAGQLASGYLNRPDQTAAAFIDLPHYGKVYRTGDRARMTENGELEILGRISSGQVKLRGQRVELGEIESVICRTSGIQVAVVSIIDDGLVAFCMTGDEHVSTQDVLSTCKKWLPRFMRPGDVVVMKDHAPRLPSGKLDRKALEAQYHLEAQSRRRKTHAIDNTISRSENEKVLLDCIEAELRSTIKANTSLWSQGLDSLKAIQLASTLRTIFPQITVSSILNSDTVSDLAILLQTKKDSLVDFDDNPKELSDWDDLKSRAYEQLRSEVESDLVAELLPCSPMQIAMLAETSAKVSLNFNIIELEMSPSISRSALADAFLIVAERNEIMRTGFISTRDVGMPFLQVVWKKLSLDSTLDLRHPFKFSFPKDDAVKVTVSIHHALYDGWSWDLIMSDVNTTLAGRSPVSRPQFRVVSGFQQQYCVRSDKASSYWQETLKNASSSTFPVITSLRASTSKKCRVSRVLTASSENMKNTSHRMHVSRQSIACAAWMALLSTYVGSSDIISGIVTSGRTLPIAGIQNIIGPCINTFPLRVDLSKVQTVRDLLFYVHRLQHDLLRYEGLGLVELKKCSDFRGDDSLFDTLFVWQEGMKDISNEPRLLTTINTLDSLDYAIILEIEPEEVEIIAKITFEASKIPNEHASVLLEQFDHLIAVLTQERDRDLADLWQAADLSILSIANQNFARLDSACTLTSTIEKLAFLHPQRIAVEFVRDYDPLSNAMQTECLSYADLLEGATAASEALKRRWGIGPGNIVCIIADKSLDLYMTLLAVMIAGAAYMCIDIRTPSDRIHQILKEAKCRLILSDISRPLSLPRDGPPRSTIGELRSFQLRSAGVFPVPESGSDLAYAVFTSGSTGIPKGVLITRGNLLSNIDCLSKIYPSHPDSAKVLQACSPAFDVSVFEIFWTWHMGMTLCTASNDVLFRDLEGFIVATGITHLSMTPSVAALVNPDKIPRTNFLVTAGEPMNSKVFEDWANKGLYQGYGPSETTNICSVRPKVAQDDTFNNVGPPLSNTSFFICDRNSEGTFSLLPKGASGEIWIGGEQVGRGYTDSDLTKRSFIEHPEYGRLYRSGDIGRLLTDGSLVVLGREDDQVKVRGQRIELGDINAALVRGTFVADAVTIVSKQGTTDRLIAFWTSYPDLSSIENNKALFRELEAVLPNYMIPDVLVPVHGMPLTRQGKSDKAALIERLNRLAPTEAHLCFRGSGRSEDEEILSKEEASIAELLSKITGCPYASIRRNTSFFALGIDSISSIRVARDLRELGLGQIDVSTIMRYSTIDRLMKAVTGTAIKPTYVLGCSEKSLQANFEPNFTESIRVRYSKLGLDIEEIVPCTSLQEAMLSAGEASNSSAYQNELRFRVVGNLAVLKDAWVSAIARHQILRTGFVLTSSAKFPYAQVVLANFEAPWLDMEESEGDSNEGFQLFQLPPYQIFVRSENTGPVIVLKMHHALYDAEAMCRLLGEIEASYRGEDRTDTIPFDAYLNYMVGIDLAKAEAFWRDELKGFKHQALIKSLVTASVEGQGREQVTAKLISSVSLQTLQTAAQDSSTTILSWLQSSWARLLSSYFGSTDVCFGNVFSGRNLPIDGINRVVGPCFNTLPVRVDVAKSPSNQRLARFLHETNIKIGPFQPTSLRWIQKLQPIKSIPLFDTLLLLQSESASLDSSIWVLEKEIGDMSFPTILEVVPDSSNNILVLMLHNQSGISSTSREILENFDSLLHHSIRYPESCATDYSTIQNHLPESCLSIMPEPPWDGTDRQPSGTDLDWSETELHVRQIYSHLSSVSPDDVLKATTLFQLGLDSINAIQIAAKLRDFGFNVTGGDVLEAPSVEELASACNQKIRQASSASSFDLAIFDKKYRDRLCRKLGIAEYNVHAVRPCTPTQAGILAQFIRSQGKLYFNSLRLKLNRNIDVMQLRGAWEQAAERHEMLRTGFAQIGDSRHPFGMITYLPRVRPVQWEQSTVDQVSLSAPNKGSAFLSSLQSPPWCLSILETEIDVLMEISMLHALYDAQALDQVLADVASLYHKRKLPKAPPISPVLTIILDQAREEESTREFWRSMAVDMQPTKFPDLTVYHSCSHETFVASLNCSMSRFEVQKKCRKLGVSLQVACQSAWAQLLAAYTGQKSVTFGVIVSGRISQVEIDHRSVFPCMNALPFAIKVEDNVHSLLRKVGALNAGLLKHQATPLTSVKKWLGCEEELFDSVFVLQKFDSAQHDAPWVIVDDIAKAEYAVSMEVIPGSGEITEFRLTVREDIMPVQQAKLILPQFDALLKAILHQLDEESIDDSLRSVVVAKEEFLDAPVLFLHQFVERTTKFFPGKTALEFVTAIDEDGVTMSKWTYSQLDSEGNRIAQVLVRYGVVPGELVGVCFDKCPEASFAILGILKAGCAYIALDPGAPQARKDFILRDAACHFVLTSKDKCPDFEALDGVTTLAMDDKDVLNTVSTEPPTLARKLLPGDTCYCLYTSGTTGKPKGCLISHRSAVQAMVSFQRIFKDHWDENSRWLQFASFHFDVSVLEQYWSWSVGICMTSAPRDLLFEDLPGALRMLKITHLDLTPSLAKLLYPHQVPDLCRGVFIVGGEQVGREILDVWGDVGCLYNFYGPSEVTIGCTVHKRVPKNTKPTNIGQQWENVGSFVLKPSSEQPVLRGAMGELCLSGPLVGKGYLNRKELTEEKFVMLDRYKTRIYRTGDLVRLLYDNSFDFLGRFDDQVKLRGQRLEIGEINHMVANAALEIKHVATMVLKHPQQVKEQLVSFFTTGNSMWTGEPPILSQNSIDSSLLSCIRERCASGLPTYMVPTFALSVSFMPLTANNKVDSKGLQALFERTPVEELQMLSMPPRQDKGSSAVQTTKEIKKIIEVLASFLDLPLSRITPSSRFFELGLDSISIISFSAALRHAGYVYAHPAVVMSNLTVGDLGRSLAAQEHSDLYELAQREARQRIEKFENTHWQDIAHLLEIPSGAIERIVPCTPLQEGMIFAAHKESSPVYFSSFSFELYESAATSDSKLQKAWNLAREKLPILRTHFVTTQGGSAQVVLKASHAVLIAPTVFVAKKSQLKSVNGIPEENQVDRWNRIGRGFGRKPCWEVQFSTQEEQTRTMHLSIFHGLYDGTSLPLILENVASELQVTRTLASYPYHDALAYGPLCRLQGAEAFWKENLQSIQRLSLPLRHEEKTPMQTARQDIVYTDISALESLQERLGVTMSAIFHAAWLLVLEENFALIPTLGMVVSGRAIALPGDTLKVVGPMFNTLPWSIGGLSKGSKWVDLVKKCAQFTSTTQHQHSSLRDVARWTNQPSPHFDCLFVFQRSGDEEELLSAPGLWKFQGSTSFPVCPLAIEVRMPLANRHASEEHRVGHQQECPVTITILSEARFLNEQDLKHLVQSLLTILSKFGSDGDQHLLPEGFQAKEQHSRVIGSKSQAPPTLEGKASEFTWSSTSNLIRDHISIISTRESYHITEFTNIFGLGLDSIDAVRLSAALKSKGLTLSVRDIMRNPTIWQMMDCVGTPEVVSVPRVDFVRVDRQFRKLLADEGHDLSIVEAVMPATPIQEGIVANFHWYYNFTLLRLRPGIGGSRLYNALRTVFRHHPIFRTRFVKIEDTSIASSYVQIVTKNCQIPYGKMVLPVTRGSTFLETVVHSKLDAVKRKGTESPMIDLTAIVEKDGQKSVLLGMSHAVYDAWSIELFHQAVSMAYFGHVLPPAVPCTQHLEVALTTTEESTSFWKQYLANAPISVLPSTAGTFHPLAVVRPSVVSMEQTRKCFEETDITLHSLGLACWALVLAHRLKKLDVCFGVVISGRTTENAERLMFPTFNTIVFRVNLQNMQNVGAREFLRHVHEMTVQVSEHQHFPLRKALYLCGHADKSNNSGPLFNSLYVLQKSVSSDLDQDGVQLNLPKLYDIEDWSTHGQPLNPAYPVNVEMEVVQGQLQWTGVCEGEVMNSDQLARALADADQILQWLVAFCTMRKTVIKVSQADGQDASDTLEICGLPAITVPKQNLVNAMGPRGGKQRLQASPPGHQMPWSVPIIETTPRVQDQNNDETWSHMEAEIRDVLVAVAKLNGGSTTLKISRKMNLFRLGIDSIGAIKVAGSLKKKGIILPVSEMMQNLTIEKMAIAASTRISTSLAYHEAAKTENANRPKQWVGEIAKHSLGAHQLHDDDVEDILPATSGQIYMLGMWRASGGRLFYPEFQIKRRHVDSIYAIWKKLVERLPILRTVFMIVNNNIYQVILKNGLAKMLPRSLVHTVTEDESQTSEISLKIHHALYDAVSLADLLSELESEDPSYLRTYNTNFRSFLQSTQGPPSLLEVRKEFWTAYLSSSFITKEKSIEFDENTQYPYRVERYLHDLIPDITKLRATTAEAGISVPNLLIAAVAKVYHTALVRHLSQNQGQPGPSNAPNPVPIYVVIGVYLANRSFSEEGETLAAPTLNIVPVKVRVSNSVTDLLQVAIEVREDLGRIGRKEHCGVSLQEIYEWTDGGVVLDCVVNFLMTQDQNGDSSNRHAETADKTAKAISEAVVPKQKGQGLVPSPFLGGDKAANAMDLRWCKLTTDVEARIEGNRLAVGIFGHDRHGEFPEWTSELKEYLEGIIK